VPDIEFGFTIKGYPGDGRRTEDEVDLQSCDNHDLGGSAFMGDPAMTIDGQDFGTRWGWVTLLYWLLMLGNAVHALEAADSHVTNFQESDDCLSFRRGKRFTFIAAACVASRPTGTPNR
jgi:hypothetical protein